ncbi:MULTISPECIES: hypothetical protein [unclassified Mesorhizobium]|uniref:hypothetical protein n=1 Tax=unclassified Mesorhizobium TaxID=325217 RepID=UPI000FD6DFFE|nr:MULTISPECIES: hypothetical protein [unclassified Mesorhizobium]RWE22245.1 MAG: hypothetical protein EOS41_24995 [Mesorhizobium sp.]TGQ21359.1 hypothetical protein EN860_014795 [Mesorhizobium sp. M00.F.Ca.ET.217.01.1.1]TGV84132.1 hypothetical protein EN801_031195 [Mesorhizobium sp. M00.F.Ca.ET.158.01.1.1]
MPERDLGIYLRLNQERTRKVVRHHFDLANWWCRVLGPNCSPADGQVGCRFLKGNCLYLQCKRKGAATRDGAANAVGQLIAIATIGMDAPRANQPSGDLAM